MMLDEYYDGKRKCFDPWDGRERPLEDIGDYGETPLLHACQRGLERVALRLLEIEGVRWDGAVRTITLFDPSPLNAACDSGLERVALRLLEGEKDEKTGKWKLKVDPTRRSEKIPGSRATMQVAEEKGLWEVVKRLKEVGVEEEEGEKDERKKGMKRGRHEEGEEIGK